MYRLMMLALVAAGVAAGVPAAGASYAAGVTGREARDLRDGRVEVTMSKVECPSGRADVIMTAPRHRDVVEYSVYRGGSLVRNGVLWPGVQRNIPVYLEPRTSERVTVTIQGQGTTTFRVYSGCEDDAPTGSSDSTATPASRDSQESYGEYRESVYSESDGDSASHSSGEHGARHVNGLRAHRYNPLLRRQGIDRLPYTGPPADLYGKMATAVGMVIFGGMLWGIAVIWPHRAPVEPLLRPRPLYATGRRPLTPS
ncbi:hypothetical protein ABZT47_16545 [Sphaerisporangium sp. NPDC005289]|uniref:hypothetical protein n=1 Tax=Sphaerisporangium sp. NPDC005289 TaxID=3155247 RepID=UPI00339F206B